MLKSKLVFISLCFVFVISTVNANSFPDENVLNIKGNDKNVSYDCENRNVIITGNNNVVILKGTCNNINVSGNNHKVTVDKVALITMSGSENRVYWKFAKGKRKRPALRKSGYNNRLIRYRKKPTK